jgi:Rrf2 family protein
MLRFTKRADYGLMAIHYIAVHEELGAVSAKRVADEYGIPQELLAKILQRLARQGLIISQNGPKGGYLLARPPSEIAVGQVLKALEGPVSIVECFEADSECPQMERCNLRRPAQKLQVAITHMLDTMSLAELTAPDAPALVTRA